MAMVLDDINKKIISNLREGRKSFKEIANSLSIAENTVKSRIRKMEDAGIIDITTVVNPEKLEGHQIVMIGIQVEDLNYLKTGEKIIKLKRVINVNITTGRYDFIITVHLDSGFDLLKFLSTELSKVKGITVSETFVVYKSINLKIPYLLEDE